VDGDQIHLAQIGQGRQGTAGRGRAFGRGYSAREEILLAAHFPPASETGEARIPEEGSSFQQVDVTLVGALLQGVRPPPGKIG
jgi:hypothetical protein